MSLATLVAAWGQEGALALAAQADVLAVVDVLSYGTAVDIALSRGAVVIPADSGASDLPGLASKKGALLASKRAGSGYSLSPPSLASIPEGTRLVLPSPNGGAVSAALADRGKPVLLGALRNATAIANAALALGQRIGLVACGERHRDGSWRAAEEDLIGLGAIASAMGARYATKPPLVAKGLAVFASSRIDLELALASTPSGIELIERGFPDDVRCAAQWDISSTVPILRDGFYSPLMP
jgi:2-phosphosulfolactate phosphatase